MNREIDEAARDADLYEIWRQQQEEIDLELYGDLSSVQSETRLDEAYADLGLWRGDF